MICEKLEVSLGFYRIRSSGAAQCEVGSALQFPGTQLGENVGMNMISLTGIEHGEEPVPDSIAQGITPFWTAYLLFGTIGLKWSRWA